MTLWIDLPEATVARLQTEAARRGVSIDEVIAELAEQLPAQPADAGKRKLAFVGAGESRHGITARLDELQADGFGRD